MSFVHTPYDGSSKPFSIGLKPLDLAAWIEVDDHLGFYLAEKDRLYAAQPGKVLVEEAETREAQREVLDLLADHLPEQHPRHYSRAGDAIRILPAHRSVDLGEPSLPPLHIASLLVQEDLILMRRGDDGWRLAAASLCFPSSWSLGEKFGRPLQDIHQPVPGFGRGTRTADIITRIFDNLAVDMPVARMNWSLQDDPELYRPLSHHQREERATSRPLRFPGVDPAASAFIRVERQTLRRLPRSGDILFTIRIYLDPMKRLADHPQRAEIAASFASQLAALDADQLDYKGLSADRDRLVTALTAIASA